MNIFLITIMRSRKGYQSFSLRSKLRFLSDEGKYYSKIVNPVRWNPDSFKTLSKTPLPDLIPHQSLLSRPRPSHLLIAGVLPLTRGGGTAGGGRFGVAVFPAAVAVAGVVALLVRQGVVFPVVGASTAVNSLSGGSWVRLWLSWCTCGVGPKVIFMY